MRAPRSYIGLEKLGRARLSRHFEMRNFLYSEIANHYRRTNVPDDPDLAIAAGTRLAEDLLEPLVETFGPIDIRSGYRSASLNHFGATEAKPQKCASNEANRAGHIWDLRDAKGRMGATVSVSIPWFAVQYNAGRDWRDLAWWLYDHLDFHAAYFFPVNASFNLTWRADPGHGINSYIAPKGRLAGDGLTPDPQRAERYADFPPFRGIGYPKIPAAWIAPMPEPLVMVPGMMADARAFLPQIVELSWTTAIHVAPPLSGATVEEMAQVVLASAPAKFALCGHGLGGMVAMEILRRAPDRVVRVALMSTSCQAELPKIAAAREPRIVAARAGRFDEAMLDEIRAEHLADTPARDGIRDAVLEMAADLGPDIYVRQSRALQKRPDQQGTLRKLRTPALILCGEFDPVQPLRRHEFMAHLMMNAKLEVVPGAGHLPALENPNAVSESLLNWLSWPTSGARVSRGV